MKQKTNNIYFIWLFTSVVLLTIFILLKMSWISDSSMITIRSLINLNSNLVIGIRSDERVMAFMHPLWFSILIPFSNLALDYLYHIMIGLNLIFVIAACFIIFYYPQRKISYFQAGQKPSVYLMYYVL